MGNQLIVTISRQFGSGGHQIGERLAAALDIPLFDKDAIGQAAKEYGLYERIMATDARQPSPTNSLLFSIAANMYPLSRNGISLEQQIILAEEETMRNLSKEGSCLFVGRAADAIFRSAPNRMSFFIHAPIDWRAERVAKHYDMSMQKAKNLTRQMDKKRAAYYAGRSESKWGDAQTYHLSIDSSLLGMDGTARQILAFLRAQQL